MENTITLHFTPASGDYDRAALALQAKKGEVFSAILIYAVLFVMVLLAVFYYLPREGDFRIYLIIGLAAVAFLGLVVVLPYRYRKHFRENPQLTMPVTWELDEQGLIITNALTVVRHDWRIFREARETAEYFYLIYAADSKQFLFLPKKAFESAQQMEAYRALTRQKFGLGAEKNPQR